jgi:hypothetical protein
MQIDPTEWEAFSKHIKNLPQEEILREHEAQEEENVRVYEGFMNAFSEERCDFCGKPLKSFAKNSPCLHWLLRPKGVKKNSIRDVLTERGYFRSATYVRWATNQEIFLARINDLKSEGNTDALFHWTAQYKHIKWTFWCTQNDIKGHGGKHSSMPHFHIEIRLENQVFVKFSDFHIPFTDDDLFNFQCNSDPGFPVIFDFGGRSSGMNDAMSLKPEDILESAISTAEPEDAIYNIQSIVMAEEGETIPMDKFLESLDKSKQSGKSVAHYLNESDLNAQIHVFPAEFVVEKVERNNPRKKG